MAALPREAFQFATAIYKKELVFLTGGTKSACTQASVYNISKNEWQAAPNMKFYRYKHASCCLGELVFVFGGYKVSSVEALHVSCKAPWAQILEKCAITERALAAVVQSDEL